MFKINVDADVKRAEEALEKAPELMAKANRRMSSDIARRVPAKVKKAVRGSGGAYNVDNAGYNKTNIKPKKRMNGDNIEVDIEYSGERLSLEHFKQSKNTIRLQKVASIARGDAFEGSPTALYVHQPRAYKIAVTIIRGHRVKFGGSGSPFFLAQGHAFKRTSDARLPINSLATLSVPQMITGRASEQIQNDIDQLIEDRGTNAVRQMLKKL